MASERDGAGQRIALRDLGPAGADPVPGGGPLGLLPAARGRVPASTVARLAAIEAFDLSAVKRAGVRDHGLSSDSIDAVELGLKRFLALPLLEPEGDHPICPAPPVDRLWHAFILDTRRYRRFCDELLDGYLDHFPSTDGDEEVHVGGVAEGARGGGCGVASRVHTRASLERYFGPGATWLWGP